MSTAALVARSSSSPFELALAGPLGSLDAYISAVRQVPVLSQAEEAALARHVPDR